MNRADAIFPTRTFRAVSSPSLRWLAAALVGGAAFGLFSPSFSFAEKGEGSRLPTFPGQGIQPNGEPQAKYFRTGRELLVDINYWRGELGLLPWTYDEMTVHLAENAAESEWRDPVFLYVRNFLIRLARKQPFTDPVMLEEWPHHSVWVPDTRNPENFQELALPRYHVLRLSIATVPLSYLTAKNPPRVMKVSWATLLVDSALVRNEKRRR